MTKEICYNYIHAVSKRETERARGDGDKGTEIYEKMGCYLCKGLNEECNSYIFIEEDFK